MDKETERQLNSRVDDAVYELYEAVDEWARKRDIKPSEVEKAIDDAGFTLAEGFREWWEESGEEWE